MQVGALPSLATEVANVVHETDHREHFTDKQCTWCPSKVGDLEAVLNKPAHYLAS